MKRCLRVLLLAMCLVLFRPSYVSADVIFTDEQYEELQQTMGQLQQLNNDNLTYVNDLTQMNEQLRNSYKKQKIFWIVGSILAVISSGVIGYCVGVNN